MQQRCSRFVPYLILIFLNILLTLFSFFRPSFVFPSSVYRYIDVYLKTSTNYFSIKKRFQMESLHFQHTHTYTHDEGFSAFKRMKTGQNENRQKSSPPNVIFCCYCIGVSPLLPYVCMFDVRLSAGMSFSATLIRSV